MLIGNRYSLPSVKGKPKLTQSEPAKHYPCYGASCRPALDYLGKLNLSRNLLAGTEASLNADMLQPQDLYAQSAFI